MLYEDPAREVKVRTLLRLLLDCKHKGSCRGPIQATRQLSLHEHCSARPCKHANSHDYKHKTAAAPVLHKDSSHAGLQYEGQHLLIQHDTWTVPNGPADQEEGVVSHVWVHVIVRQLRQALQGLLDH